MTYAKIAVPKEGPVPSSNGLPILIAGKGCFSKGLSVLLFSLCSPLFAQDIPFGPPELLDFVDSGTRSATAAPDCLDDPNEFGLLYWRQHWYGSVSGNARECRCDLDRDGLRSCMELQLGTDPNNPDSDSDCLGDGLEVERGLNPLSTDSDGDSTPDNQDDSDINGTQDGSDDYDNDTLPNCAEVTFYHTNPVNPDTDGDLLDDAQEVAKGTGPLDPDSDDDGFVDGEEVEFQSNPLNPNSIPIDPNATIGEVAGPTLSVLNETNPSGDPIGETIASAFSVENEADPTGDPIGETFGLPFSIENGADPTDDRIGETFWGPFSVENEADPTGDAVGEAFWSPFSVQNQAGL